ncbi:DUF547 domain-containing protein [Hymenobacter psychrophilus]|uniref:DUF547 domain-containing protein n=1 Tax=Hymenobacter psychrophilus TaxID=651662 RepID=A0A1H3DCS3_9BACT|nr:DUF547 domain-containing protein [Hymenobacter psychrophilus]SDX64322.1 Protein of unknown function, DUF547 [Hymenobacter psychrophilus]
MLFFRNFLLTALSASTLSVTACNGPAETATAPAALAATPAAAAAFDHSAFDRLLKKYVDARGRVNYKGFRSEEKDFDAYLARLSQNPPKATDAQAEQMAFWINAYNAYTIRLILDNYPLKSIKDIGEPWKKVFFSIGGTKMSLDDIEHGILRKKFDDPRIHFALVCASISCPPLRPEAYTAARLSAQLDAQGRAFLNDTGKNKLNAQSAQLSNYFNWYKDDWNKNGQSVVKWVNKYAKTNISDNTKIGYLDYNWNLNEQ